MDEEPEELSLERQVADLLFRFELAEETKTRIREKNVEVFEQLANLDAEQTEVRDSLKRLLHTKDGPPDQVRPGSASHVWAKGGYYFVEVTYKKHGNYYDPKLLPLATFMIPGIVTEVDKGVLDGLAKKDGRIARALVQGAYMTPAVSIKRIERQSQSGEDDDH